MQIVNNSLSKKLLNKTTQEINIKDLNLKVSGHIAKKWMSIAQCFAGKASSPPKPGLRKTSK